MRTNQLAILGLTAVASLAGCTDLKEVPVTGVTAEFFGSSEGAVAASTGAYARLRDFYGQEREVTLAQVGTDSWEKGAEIGTGAPFNDYTTVLSANMSNAENRNNWQNQYQGVNAANTAIAYLSASTAIPEADKNRNLGEVRFLRALYYHNLVRTYGDVHLTLEPSQGIVLTASRTPRADIYAKAIVPDLEFAIANLPAIQAQLGRATKGAAQTLLAEVYLTRAASGDFDRAVALANDVIGSGTYALNADFRSLFCGSERPRGPCDFVAANETNREFIFSVQFTGDGVNDQWGNNLHLYYTMAYDLSGLTGAGRPSLGRTVEYGRPYRRIRPTLHLLNVWNRTTDSRYEATFQRLWQQPNGDTAIFFPGTNTVGPEFQGRPYGVFGQNQYTPQLFPTLLKWLDNTRGDPARTIGGRDRHLWRLADLYLMRAEGNIRAGRVAAAVADFNVLRRRAAKAGQNNELTAAQTAALTASPIDFLLDERERELAGEEYRWYTLARMGRETFVSRIKAFNTAAAANVKDFHALRPIPQEQIDRTEGNAQAFPQNPGY